MRESGVQVRAKWTRTAEARVPAPLVVAVRSRLGAEVCASVDAASLLGWIPAEHHVALCRGWHESLGDKAYRGLFRGAFLDAVNAPLLGSIVQGSVRVFGPTPSAAARAWRVGWPYIFRNGGQVRVGEVTERSVTIEAYDLPPALRDESFALGCAGSFEGNAAMVGANGKSQHDISRLADGVLMLSLAW